MNEPEQEPFEAELRALKAAPAPPEFVARLRIARPGQRNTSHWVERMEERCHRFLRWWLPASAAAGLVGLAIVLRPSTGRHSPAASPPDSAAAPGAALKADDVQIDRQLVAAFDAVAELPGGLPMRFRCREWSEDVVLRDSARGLIVERHVPRIEVVPVCLETY